jgi:hypothetical protein
MRLEEKIEKIKSLLINIPEKHVDELVSIIEKDHFEILALESNLKGNDKIIEGQQKEIEQMKAFIEDNEYNLTPEFKRYFPVGFRY